MVSCPLFRISMLYFSIGTFYHCWNAFKKELISCKYSGHIQKLVFMCYEYFHRFAMSFCLYFENSLQRFVSVCSLKAQMLSLSLPSFHTNLLPGL